MATHERTPAVGEIYATAAGLADDLVGVAPAGLEFALRTWLESDRITNAGADEYRWEAIEMLVCQKRENYYPRDRLRSRS
jgi:hypothetical protein